MVTSQAVFLSLSNEQEERLANLLDKLSSSKSATTSDFEAVVANHPDLAVPLRELWAAMMLADAMAEHSTVFERSFSADGGNASTSSSTMAFDSHVPFSPLAGFVPSVSSLPATLGDYELLEEIGRGGMGVVYRAEQKSLGRIVAIKMLLRRDLATGADLARFQTEAAAAAQLDHPAIVSVYEVAECDGHPFFSMQYIEGTTLSKQLSSGVIKPREAARILAEVAEAIHAAHLRGVLHRDLKPSNILIDATGSPHISDFGLAKRIESDGFVTHTGAILGTPCYMSPEQAAGSRGDVGPTSDVWSLGAILYQMLTGRPPFQASSPMDTLLAVLEADPPPPRMIDSRVNRDLEMIALKTLQKPQELRYESAAAFAADLRAFLAGEPLAARSDSFGQLWTRIFRETHHAVILENWGLLWMWHSVVLLAISVTTDLLAWQGVTTRWPFFVLWAGGLALWAPILWALRSRAGPVTFVERQIAHLWGGSVIATVMLFWVEGLLGVPVLTLSPVLALLAGLVFFAKAGILSGTFYIQAFMLFATALVMCVATDFSHVVFGVVSAGCFFVPGLKYWRQRGRIE